MAGAAGAKCGEANLTLCGPLCTFPYARTPHCLWPLPLCAPYPHLRLAAGPTVQSGGLMAFSGAHFALSLTVCVLPPPPHSARAAGPCREVKWR